MIYLIRHTTPDIAAGICYGQTDVPLADSFAEELILLGKKLPVISEPIVMSSPSQRCLRLASALFSGSEIHVDNRLLEMSFGDWEMRAWDDIDQDTLKHWGSNFVTAACPNGESLAGLDARVQSLWKGLNLLNENYVLFTHSGVIRVILAHLLGAPLEKAFTLEVLYADVVRVKFIDTHNCSVRFL